MACRFANLGRVGHVMNQTKTDFADWREAAMKRIIMGFVWFVVLYFGILAIGEASLGPSKESRREAERKVLTRDIRLGIQSVTNSGPSMHR